MIIVKTVQLAICSGAVFLPLTLITKEVFDSRLSTVTSTFRLNRLEESQTIVNSHIDCLVRAFRRWRKPWAALAL
jgi:hypothetical protein